MTASGSECSGAPQGLVSELILINVCVKNKWDRMDSQLFHRLYQSGQYAREYTYHSEKALHAGEMGWQDTYEV